MDASWLPPRRVGMCPPSLVHLACTGCVASVCFCFWLALQAAGRFFRFSSFGSCIRVFVWRHGWIVWRLRAIALVHARAPLTSDAKRKGLQQPRGQHATLSALCYTSVLSRTSESCVIQALICLAPIAAEHFSPAQPCSSAERRSTLACRRSRSTRTPPPRQLSRVPQRRRSTRAPPTPARRATPWVVMRTPAPAPATTSSL